MRYATIVADPPWEIKRGVLGGPDRPMPYPMMDVEAIAALPVAQLADNRAHLYLWTINAYIEDAYEVVRHWGFRPVTLLTWCKPPLGAGTPVGGTFVNSAEFVIFARRGILRAQERVGTTWWQWPRGAHSAKPEAFLDLVEQVSPPPRLEIFARRARFGWDYAGNESLGTVNLPGLLAPGQLVSA